MLKVRSLYCCCLIEINRLIIKAINYISFSASPIGTDLQSIRGSCLSSSLSIFLEPVRPSIPPKRYTGHRLSQALGTYEWKNPNLQGVSSNKTDGGSQTPLKISSRAFSHLGEVGPLYNREPTFELEMVTVAQRSAASPGSEESFTGSMTHEDTLTDGIRIEERYTSRKRNINALSSILFLQIRLDSHIRLGLPVGPSGYALYPCSQSRIVRDGIFKLHE